MNEASIADVPIIDAPDGHSIPGGGRRGMTWLKEACEQSGHTRVMLEVWPGGRREMLNEI